MLVWSKVFVRRALPMLRGLSKQNSAEVFLAEIY